MPIPQDVAAWMWHELQRYRTLRHRHVVRTIREHFGEQFLYSNQRGNPAISKCVLDSFRIMHGGNARWDRRHQSWWLPSPIGKDDDVSA